MLRESNWSRALKDPLMKKRCSGVILCKGPGTHLTDKDNVFFVVEGTPVTDHLLAVFRSLFDDVLLVASDPTHYLPWDLQIVTDIDPTRNSLSARVKKVKKPSLWSADPDLIFLFRIKSSPDIAWAERWPESGRKPLLATQGERDG